MGKPWLAESIIFLPGNTAQGINAKAEMKIL